MSVVRKILRRGVKPTQEGDNPTAMPENGRGRAFFVYTALAGTLAGLGASPAANAVAQRSLGFEQGGFPQWYEDANGVRLQLCYDPNDPNCTAPVSATYNPALPLSYPNNYPDELFYSAADSAPLATNDTACGGGAGATPGIVSHAALEASYLNGVPAFGDQIVFGRLRVIARAGSGLCANQWYTFRTPYGPITIKSDLDPVTNTGEIAGATASVNTIDIPGGVLGDFNTALTAPVLASGLLRQVNSAAPGYLGSGLGLDVVTGPTGGFLNRVEVVKWPDGVTPPSQGLGVDCVDAGCSVVAQTNQFSVAAKLAGPLVAPVDANSVEVGRVDFGGVLGGNFLTKSIPLTSMGAGPLGFDPSEIASVTVIPANVGFTVTGCAAGTSVPRDATCTADITFAPLAAGPVTATLQVAFANSPHSFALPLQGTGVLPVDAPAISVSPVSQNLGAVRIRTSGGIFPITVTNTGTAPLQAVPSLPAGTGFEITGQTCSQAFVPPQASCVVNVRYKPNVPNKLGPNLSEVGPKATILSIANNAGEPVAVALTANATGGISAVSSSNNAVNTFPDWYQDETGIRLGQCDDPTNTKCIAAPIVGAKSFPTNYPDEWFYYIAASDPTLSVSDCDATPGSSFVEIGTEAAFLGPIAPNQGITFDRLRIIARGGLCADTTYRFTHPYGVTVLTTDDRGNIKPIVGTTDVGCLGAPCDYTEALAGAATEGYLEQTVRPAGYLGDPLVPSTVTGAPYSENGVPFNKFRIERLDANGQVVRQVAETDLFTVSGRLVGPMEATPTSNNFGTLAVSGGLLTQDFTFTNAGIAPVDTKSIALTGAAAGDYSIVPDSDTCTPVAPATAKRLAVGASCTVTVQFDPASTGPREAKLVVNHTGRNNPLEVPLIGVGAADAGLPAISTPLTTISFPDVHTGQVSASAEVLISNVGGQADLIVGTTPRTGTNPGQFQVTNQCPGNNLARPGSLEPEATCKVLVRFAPTTAGAKTATLTVNSNAGPVTIALQGRGSSAVVQQSATSTAAGFPSWFQDGNGVRLEQCLDNTGVCALLADATFNPANLVAFPFNYPIESFYSLVDSDLVNYGPQTCADGSTTPGGFALLRVGTEATFTTPSPQVGAQTLFNRVRITASGLCPNTTYVFQTPYGLEERTTTVSRKDGSGEILPKDGTIDLANVVGTRPVTPGFLVWDPNSGEPAPVGYIGNYAIPHKVVGSQYRIGGIGEPVNYFSVNEAQLNLLTGRFDPVREVGKTDLFLVAGRKVGPVVSSTDFQDFGVVEGGRQSAITTFTVTNLGADAVSSLVVATGGANADQFTIVSNTCATTGLTLNQDQICTVGVRFTPTTTTTTSLKNATLTVSHNGLRSPVTIALQGTANAVLTPALTVTPTTLAFGNANVGVQSTGQLVTIRNGGTGALRLGAFAFGGTNPTQYRLTSTSSATACPISGAATANLAAGASCTVTVAFLPTSGGAKPATLAVSATDQVASVGHVPVIIPNANVSLTGTGAQGTIRLSATTLAISARAGASATGRITLTNNGTAPFTLQGTPVFTFTGITANTPIPHFTAGQTGCANVAVGRNCTVSVTFAPGAGTVNEVFSVNMAIASNASNNPVTVRVNGTRSR